MKIIKLTPKHLQEFKKVRLDAVRRETLAFGDSYSELRKLGDLEWKKVLNQKKQHWYGVYEDQKLIAIGSIKYATMLKFRHIAKFSGIYVDPKYRRRGVAKLLFEARIKESFSKVSIQKIKLIVNTTQKPAIALYESFGFKFVGKLKREFKIGSKYYDAYLMELLRR